MVTLCDFSHSFFYVHQRVPYLWYPWTSRSSALGDLSYGNIAIGHPIFTPRCFTIYKPPCYRGSSFIFQHLPTWFFNIFLHLPTWFSNIFQHLPTWFSNIFLWCSWIFHQYPMIFPCQKPPFFLQFRRAWCAKQRFGIHQVDAIEMTRLGRRWDSTNKKKVGSPAKNIGTYICEEKT